MQKFFWIFLGLILLVGGCGFVGGKNAYNSMVDKEEQVEAQWAQVENVYQRRMDLIPNIVETVKGYANFEAGTLTEVTSARARVGQMTVDKEVLENPELLQKFNDAQGELTGALNRLMVVSENYPELKANTQFQQLIVELEGSENRIAVERKKFNEAAQDYNKFIRKFPNNIYAGFFNFDDVAYFKAQSGAETAPKVDFNN
ncbi:LemA family protein [Pontibacter sp. G13]|uniref:LemA family protein n=1 Tax=Pontibacter sp. G13 TaxID=3074898 RepID=UPI00288A0150|nr:LemA family protein [Pontibacter sp. G13]WNJ19171.1 LemA family protein [Pontibacter sp. G13]